MGNTASGNRDDDLRDRAFGADLSGAAGRVAVGMIVVLLLGMAFLAMVLYPDDLPQRANPDFVDNVFDSRVVIWSARLLLVSAAFVLALGGVYIVLSTAIRIKNGEWLKRAGPFEVSETATDDLSRQVDFWRAAALDARVRIDQLSDELAESDRMISLIQLALSER